MNSNNVNNSVDATSTSRFRRARNEGGRNRRLVKVRRTGRTNIAEEINRSRLPKIVNRGPFPTDMIVRLKYYSRFIISGASPFLVTPEIRLNSAFQPLVGGPTGTVAGFAGASGIYDSYRVESVAVRCGYVNNENFSVSACMIVRDTQPSTSITSFVLAEQVYGSGPSIHKAILGYNTGNGTYNGQYVKFGLGKTVGNQLMYLADRDFASAVTTVPNQVVWGSMLVLSDNAAQNLTNGIFCDVEIEMVTRFFSLKNVM